MQDISDGEGPSDGKLRLAVSFDPPIFYFT